MSALNYCWLSCFTPTEISWVHSYQTAFSSFLPPVLPFIHSFIHKTIMKCLLTSRHCAGDGVQEMRIANLVSALMETTLGPIVNLKSRSDHVILCSAFFSRLSSFRAMSAVTRLVWNGLCEPLPFASPGKYRLQLDTAFFALFLHSFVLLHMCWLESNSHLESRGDLEYGKDVY